MKTNKACGKQRFSLSCIFLFRILFLLQSANSFLLLSLKNRIDRIRLFLSEDDDRITTSQPILVTFDLDDTLFPIEPVIQDANSAMICHLCDELGYSEITQADLTETSKKIRQELRNKEQMITYTELRKRAIKMETDKYKTVQSEGLDWQTVDQVYQMWETERHMAAERHLFHDTQEMLNSLRLLFPNDGIIVGAITNGKGSPFQMTSIERYFDFCVSGEDADVFPNRKPSEGIYKAALNRYRNLITSKRKMTQKQNYDKIDDVCWIHVGDDLANDVGGSHVCGAMAVWADLDEEVYRQTASKRGTSSLKHQPSWSTLSSEELKKRQKLNEKAKSCVSAKIRNLTELPAIVANLVNSFTQNR